MLVRTDDEVYRVDAVWLGPPRATFPWRARYVSYGVGLLVMLLLMFLQRRLGIGLDFFSVAWALVGTVAITRFIGQKIDYERPLGQVLSQFWAEVTGPRVRNRAAGGSVRAGHVRVRAPGGRGRGTPTAAVRTSAPTQVGAPGPGSVAEVWSGSGAPKASPLRIGARPAGTGSRSAPGRADRRAAKKAAKKAGREAGPSGATTVTAARAGSATAPASKPGTPAGMSWAWAKPVAGGRTVPAADSWQRAGSRGRR